ncbi:hypothetical protein MLD38_040743 [Melastoma candidum]|nr:hypothetical protein MLD38_040743 [Melastoma candidum]
MAANTKSSGFILAVLVAAVIHTQHVQQAQGQSCPSELSNLNMCAPFVVPGSSNLIPSAKCCSALRLVHHGCLCNTLRIASHLPSMCQLPPLACSQLLLLIVTFFVPMFLSSEFKISDEDYVKL